MIDHVDTISALATPPGRGGIGIIRISGPLAKDIALAITNKKLTPRSAHYGDFHACIDGDENTVVVDQGIALYFPGPNSFTGEDVLELQGHGGPVILDVLLTETLRLGARLANPGEFSERAFLNDKIDLTQAEAIADLIDSSSIQAARNSIRSLQGVFSQQINNLVEQLTQLRIYVEAAIDFPEEEIDFLADGHVSSQLLIIEDLLLQLLQQAKQGALLREGMTVVIAGKPNAGKSSLLNALAGKESAIVTDIAGTTRDVLKEEILLDGMPLHIIDTAGLRDNPDVVEEIGIARAIDQIEQADQVLLVVDSSCEQETDIEKLWVGLSIGLPLPNNVTVIRNKCDLAGTKQGVATINGVVQINLSAKAKLGLNQLTDHLKNIMGYNTAAEGTFTARRRHLDALERSLDYLQQGKAQLNNHGAGELLADDMYQAQKALGEITGQLSADDLLGKIFSSFCIGK